MTRPLHLGIRIAGVILLVCVGLVVFGTFHLPRGEKEVQRGYRGTGMDLLYSKAELALQKSDNALPDVIDPVEPAGQKASTIYKNLKVLGDVDVTEFGRLMASMSTWVAPTQGCAYCHGNEGNFASDALYTKRVARRMLQMTRHINADWTKHVGKTGVTCWTCHRGQPVPSYIWFNNPGPASEMAVASAAAGDSALPTDPYTPYLDGTNEIRVASTTALPSGDRSSIKQTEGTYALMMHMATSLGVNCTFCHNTRAFSDWSESTPQRVTAWYGIRMVRDQNKNFLQSLAGTFPPNRLGPHGDVPKVNCMTCHQGAYKPLLGASMISTYPELTTTADASSAPAAPASPSAAPPVPTPASPTATPPSPPPASASPTAAPPSPPPASASPTATPPSPPPASASPTAAPPSPPPASASPTATPPSPPPASASPTAAPPSPPPASASPTAASPSPQPAPAGPEPPKAPNPQD